MGESLRNKLFGRLQPKTDRNAIKRIHVGYHRGQVDNLTIIEMCAQRRRLIVGRYTIRNARHGFGPGQGGAFRLIKTPCGAPLGHRLNAIYRLAKVARLPGVKPDTLVAPVDL